MALQRAATPARRPDGTVEEVPDEIPRGRGGRPKIRELLADGTESRDRFVTMTRASTLGKTLESDAGLQVWKQRMVVHGMSRRHDLVLRAAAIPTVTEDADKKALSEVVEAALEAAKATAGATKGTALHVLSEQLDAGGEEAVRHLPPDALAALRRYRELMAPLRVVASETFVVCDALQAAGTFDRVVELTRDMEVPAGPGIITEDGRPATVTLPAGTRLVLDLKTNASARYFGPTYAAQQAVYAHGVPYTHKGGRGEWPDGIAPSQDWALILHVPLDSPVDAGFYLVSLRDGFELAELANLVRAQTDRDDLFHPVDLAPPAPPAQVVKVGLIAQLRQAADRAELDALYDAHADSWDDDCTRMAKARLAELATAVPA